MANDLEMNIERVEQSGRVDKCNASTFCDTVFGGFVIVYPTLKLVIMCVKRRGMLMINRFSTQVYKISLESLKEVLCHR